MNDFRNIGISQSNIRSSSILKAVGLKSSDYLSGDVLHPLDFAEAMVIVVTGRLIVIEMAISAHLRTGHVSVNLGSTILAFVLSCT